MMKPLFQVLCTLFAVAVSAQTPKIVVQGTGAPQVFDHFTDAIAAANADNIMYLSGGDHMATGETIIDHEVHIVGAGCDPDSAGLTTYTRIVGVGHLIFTTPASNSTITGLRVATSGGFQYGENGQTNGQVTNFLWSRCAFEGPVNITGDNVTNTFDQCVLLGGISGAYQTTTTTLNNSIVYGNASTGFAQLNWHHCLQLGGGGGGNFDSYYDCIIAMPTQAGINYGNAFVNCLFYNVNDFTQNVTNCIFTNTNPWVSNTNVLFDWTDDLHLAPGCQGIGFGTDGTDVGIYGGTSPFKPGFVPYNPHYIHLDIAPATDANGDLPVNITVKRQTN